MTRVVVYSTALVALVAATAMTFVAIVLPNWISYSSPPDLFYSYGLHRTCSSVSLPASLNPAFAALAAPSSTIQTSDLHCRPFPEPEDCQGSDFYFCGMWRTTGFLMTLSAVLELVVLVGFVVVLLGGKQKRERGWIVISGLLVTVALVQAVAMSFVAYLFDNDDRFFVGWKLDNSWILCTVSWSLTFLAGLFLALSPYIFSAEEGYELIPSERQYG